MADQFLAVGGNVRLAQGLGGDGTIAFTRLYVGTNQGLPTIPYGADWADTGHAGRRLLVPGPNGFATDNNWVHGGAAGGRNNLIMQGIYPLLAPGRLQGWVRGQFRAHARHGIGISEANQKMYSQLQVTIWRPGIGYVGTALTNYNASTWGSETIWPASSPATNRKFPTLAKWTDPVLGAALTPVNYIVGDWLVIEIGNRNFTTTPTGKQLCIRSNKATDLPIDESTQTDLNSWIDIAVPTPLSIDFPYIWGSVAQPEG